MTPPIERCQVAPFRHLRINACLPTPRSLSQATTSFIASGRLGIHHAPLTSLTTSMNRCLCKTEQYRLTPIPQQSRLTVFPRHDKPPPALHLLRPPPDRPETINRRQRTSESCVRNTHISTLFDCQRAPTADIGRTQWPDASSAWDLQSTLDRPLQASNDSASQPKRETVRSHNAGSPPESL